MKGLGFGLYQSGGNRMSVGCFLCLGCSGVGGVDWEWVELEPGSRGRWGVLMFLYVVSLDSLCIL